MRMSFSIRRWGVGHVMGAWAGYWVGLGAATLAPFARWAWELARIPGQHGSASLSVGDAGVTPTSTPSPVERRDQRGS
ncbi:MAG: hypothetical protein JJD97_02985 [Gemmatimonadaceae bacterium]|nr:hypothetical protein [Gemmatimonadaceae bacterium]